MKKRKIMGRRALSLFIALTMCLGSINLTAFAADDDAGEEITVSVDVEAENTDEGDDTNKGEDEKGDEGDDANKGEDEKAEDGDDANKGEDGNTEEGEDTNKGEDGKADEIDDANVDEIDISAADELIEKVPGANIETETKTEISSETDPDTGKEITTTTTTTDKKWESNTESKGEYDGNKTTTSEFKPAKGEDGTDKPAEGEDVTDKPAKGENETSQPTEDETYQPVEDDNELRDAIGKIVDDLKGDNPPTMDLDEIADGTYIKTEEEINQDVVIKVEGEDHRTDSATTDSEGNKIKDSFEVNGQQTTTTTTTTTTNTTTTTVEKTTGEEKKTGDSEGAKSDPVLVAGPTEESLASSTEKDAVEETTTDPVVEVELGDDLFDSNKIESGELTVSKGTTTTTSGEKTATSVNINNVTRDLLAALDGWTVKSGDIEAIVKVGEDGVVSYVDAEGNIVEGFEIGLTSNNNTYSIEAKKITTTVIKGDLNTDIKEGSFTTEKGDRSDINWGDYELDGEAQVQVNEDGSITKKYYKKTGTAERIDTNQWIEVTTRVDGVTEVTQSAIVSATLSNGTYEISTKWGGVKDNNANNDQTVITVLGPSQNVIQIALNNRANTGIAPTSHIIIANAYKDMTAAELEALASGGSTSDGIKLEGSFLQSSVFIKDASGGGTGAWLRRMSDGKGNFFYVYCAQHGKATSNGTGYDIVNIDENGYLYTQNANHIQYVVEKGWWGTDSGVGSLDAVKELVSADKRSQIDEGIALAATQAAIWYYSSAGHDGNKTINPDEDVFTKAWTTGVGSSYTNLTNVQKAAAMELFNALIQKDKTNEQMAGLVNNTTDFIHEDDITSTSIQVVEKVDVSNVAELTEMVKESLEHIGQLDSSKGLYKTNVAVTLAVVPSKLNSNDLMVYVYSGGTVVGSKRVDQAALEANGGKVTIENIVLENGAKVRFHLDGTQYLAEGAYLFRSDVNCTGSQTMVGYVKGSTQSNKVDLDVNMTFNVATNKASGTGTLSVTNNTKEYEETYTTESSKTSTTEVTEYYEKIVCVTTTTKTETDIDSKKDTNKLVWSDEGSNSYEVEETETTTEAPKETETTASETTTEAEGESEPETTTEAETESESETTTEAERESESETTTEAEKETEPSTEATTETVPDNNVPQSGGNGGGGSRGGSRNVTSQPNADISDDDVPLANVNQEDIMIPDVAVPLAGMPTEAVILDEDVPLIGMPKTGDASHAGIWYALTLLSAAGILMLTIAGRKKREED